ncbi:hypothetical protein [Actinomadura vinacea]|uniref:hypothetical protein n=1 Tax=Actinomadura vinacea TaxID=115336 RepID=UPI0031DD78CB
MPAVQAPGRVTTVGLAALKAPVDWDKTKNIRTIDGDPGGQLQWDPETGRVRVCDVEDDGHYVRGYAYKKGVAVARVRAGEKGKCDEASTGYKSGEGARYDLVVCLATENGEGYCNNSTSGTWPKAERSEDDCEKLDGKKYIECVGGVDQACGNLTTNPGEKKRCIKNGGEIKEPEGCELLPPFLQPAGCGGGGGSGGGSDSGDGNCALLSGKAKEVCLGDSRNRVGGGSGSGGLYSTEKPDVPAPPNGSPGDKDPYVTLPRGHAEGVSAVAGPLAPLLRWLVWTVLGACVLGFMLVGGNMAIKHKRSEAGAHAAGLGWVMLASVVAASGAAVAFISLLIDPL